METKRQWETLANEAIADAGEWKARARKLETDLADCRAELETYRDAYEPGLMVVARLRDERAALVAALEAVAGDSTRDDAEDALAAIQATCRATLAQVKGVQS